MSHPSIFNDVLGPVMRGPSSSHCAAALRIGRICRDLMEGRIHKVHIEFDTNGSLATTHKSQGSDMGLFGGFLGWEAHDERLQNYEEAIAVAGIDVHIQIHDIGAEHPNTYKMTLSNDTATHEVVALSIGGGMIEIIEIDACATSMVGDYHVTLIFAENLAKIIDRFELEPDIEEIVIHDKFVEVRTISTLRSDMLNEIKNLDSLAYMRELNPVLPILSRRDVTVPFTNAEEMVEFAVAGDINLWQLASKYEASRGGISEDIVFEKMRHIVRVMQGAIDNGLAGTEYEDRILGPQSLQFQKKLNSGELIQNDVLNQAILNVTAIMETKSSMGVIVAAPTAGACGALPGAVLGTSSKLGLSEDDTVMAMLAAGIIGVFIADKATFAAEVGGCQAECGSGAGMAAAAIVQLAGGSLEQCLAAASFALQNSFGMICDPVANRVEAPCLGKNITAASNAISSANIALADFDHLIPLDQVIEAMDKVGHAISHELRCTGLGGLAITQASKEIEARLNGGELVEEELGTASQKFKYC